METPLPKSKPLKNMYGYVLGSGTFSLLKKR